MSVGWCKASGGGLDLHCAILRQRSRNGRMRLFASYAVLLLCIALRSEAAAATLAAWVQLGPNGAVSARAVTDDSSCPTLRGDGVALTMTVRAPPDAVLGNVPPAVFDVRTCEAAVASGTAELL